MTSEIQSHRFRRARRCSSRLAAAGLVAALAAAAPPELGPWAVSELTFKVPALDATDPSVWLVFPVCNATSAPPGGCPRFPLVSYAHGMAGGDIDLLGYAELFYQLASYGFVVAAPDSCDVGCTDPSGGAPWTDCAGLPDVQPALWPAWYGELLKTIDWARNQTANATAEPVFSTIDWGAGVGIAGHHGPYARVERRGRPFGRVEPQACLSAVGIEAVTGEAVGRQDRQHVAVEGDRGLARRERRNHGHRPEDPPADGQAPNSGIGHRRNPGDRETTTREV